MNDILFWISIAGLIAMPINFIFAIFERNASASVGWLCAFLIQVAYMGTAYAPAAAHIVK